MIRNKISLIILIASCLLGSFDSFSQSFSPTVHPTSGGTDSIGNVNFYWTIGQTFNNTLQNGNLLFTEGEQQPYVPIITTGTNTPLTLCAGIKVIVHYTTTVPMNEGNTFVAQLSDTSGSFANPVIIGFKNIVASDSIECTIPANAITDSRYRIRIISSNPAITGTDNGSNITINRVANPTIGYISPLCVGSIVYLLAGGGVSYSWTGPNGFTTSQQNPTINNTSLNTSGVYTVTVSAANGCTKKDSVNLLLNPTPNIIIIDPPSVCKPSVVNLTSPTITAGSTSGLSYNYWTDSIATSAIPRPDSITASGTYYIKGTAAGCATIKSVQAKVTPYPTAIITPNSLLCIEGGSSTLFVVDSTPGLVNNYSYVWTPGNSTADSLLITTPGTYGVTLTNNGCSGNPTNILVSLVNCIFPYFSSPDNGKTSGIVSPDVFEYQIYPDSIADTTTIDDLSLINNNLVIVDNNDSAYIIVIPVAGMYNTVLALLQSPAYGMTDIIDNGGDSIIIGKIPRDTIKLNSINTLTTLINSVTMYYAPVNGAKIPPGIGVAYSSGDVAMRADRARKVFKVNGNNVKIGILSDSYNKLGGAQTNIQNEDLPASSAFTLANDYPYGKRSDEGRAMMQILHDIAPKATLNFRTGFLSAANMAEGIRALESQGCNIIVDDLTYVTEPFFQDGVISQAVDSAKSHGVSYFTSAGNFGNKSYEGIFNQSDLLTAYGGRPHKYANSPKDTTQHVSLKSGTYLIALQWEDSWYSLGQQSGATNDLDIYLLDSLGNRLFGFNNNNIGKDPVEILPFTVKGNSQANIMVVRSNSSTGPANVRFKYIVFKGELTMDEYKSGSATIVGQANAKGAITVGAVRYTNTPAFKVDSPFVESFSSIGGLIINNETRSKPDFVAPDGVNTTVNLGGKNIDNDAFPNFFGTSAAVPHAAGVAALMQEAQKKFFNDTLNPDEIRLILRNTALNMGTAGYDSISGYGFIQADSALAFLATGAPYIDSLDLPNDTIVPGTTPFTVSIYGSFFNNQTQVWFNGALINNATYVNSSLITAQIPVFGNNPPLYLYNAPLNNTYGSDGGYSDSTYFFRRKIVITANDTTKKYGEQLPVFTSTVSIDGLPLDSFGLTRADLKLDSIKYLTSAVNFSNTGIYFIQPYITPLDAADSLSAVLLDQYDYEFVNGLLTIQKMNLVIKARDTTLTYGNKIIPTIKFKYDYDSLKVKSEERSLLFNELSTEHQSRLADALVLVDARNLVNAKNLINARNLINSDFQNISFLASARSLNNARNLINARNYVNNFTDYDTTRLIDVDAQNIINYNFRSDSSSLIDARNLINAKNFVNARSLINAKYFINGTGFVNAKNFINAKNYVNAKNFVNSSTITDSSNENIAVIIDADDVNAPAYDTLEDFVGINMITGFTSGVWTIVPGAYLTENYDVSYQLGKLTILADTLTVKAKDTVLAYGAPLAFTFNNSGYHYYDADSTVISGPPQFTILDTMNMVVTGDTIPPGIYHLQPGSIPFTNPLRYTPQYVNGTLLVLDACTSAVYDSLLSQYVPFEINDLNPCTIDGCNLLIGVFHIPSSCNTVLNLKVLFEAFYISDKTMLAVVDPFNNANNCDTIIVELHESLSPYNLMFSDRDTIDIHGNGNFVFPAAVQQNSYYIVVRHRNSIETWSKDPVFFGNSLVPFDFTKP